MCKEESDSNIILGFSVLSKHIEDVILSFLSEEVVKELMRVLVISKLIAIV